MNEKKERFKRVGARRVDSVVKGLRSLSNCSNTNNYEFTEEEVNKMLKVIKEEIKLLETLFKKNLSTKSNNFNF
tara:strand:+ start:199 stop:420 length:222 start_codon:yes stop_codon:yes gene_type:complete